MDAGLAKLIFSHALSRERRFGIDRRQINYDLHIPERRSGKDRRSGTVKLCRVSFPISPKKVTDLKV